MPQLPRGKPPAGTSPAGISPSITSIVTVPGLDKIGQGSLVILVGIVIDNSSIAWGTCAASPVDVLPEFHAPLSLKAGIVSIEEIVAPSLVGQKLATFRHLANVLESLKESVTISQPIPQPEGRSRGVSRRAIISGFLASSPAEEAAGKVKELAVERAIHPSIRHGLSEALLSAVAMNRGVTATQVITEEFNLPAPSTAVALQMPIRRGQKLQLHDQVSTLAYTVDGERPEESLGANGERIQRFVRKLRERLAETGQQHQITIHLDVGGGLGQIFDQDAGKVLGALYGLEQAAAPCLIRVQDPLVLDDLDAQIEALSQLRSYTRMREMSLQLAASAGINTLDDVRTFAQAKAAHMLHLAMPRLGTIQETVLASQECQACGIGILLEGTLSDVTSQVALAIQPDVFTCPVDQPTDAGIAAIHNEMVRTLAWLAR